MATRCDTRRREAGQMVVIMAAAMVGIVAMVALIIDGGTAWANERIVQNGTDAAAEAGAVVLAQKLAGAAEPTGGWDAAVSAAVTALATANGITVQAAYYTDVCGITLQGDGSKALKSDGSYDFVAAKQVGTGLPTVTTTTPDCPSRSVGPVAGVLVVGHKDVPTYLARVVGIDTLPVGKQATAASGYIQDAGEGSLLPITVPVNVVTCDGQNRPIFPGGQWSADGHTVYKVPLCKNDPGNVGWLDWTPPGGGTSDVINEILHPNNPPIPLPSWQYVSQTGNPNSQGLENAVRTWDGHVVLLPQFDLTCNPDHNGTPDSSSPAINTLPLYGCPSQDELGGSGQNQWYRMPSVANFKLCDGTDPDCAALGAYHGAYINGTNTICDSGNGATSCLIGKFMSIQSGGTIGTGAGGGSGHNKAVGVQLIK